MCLVSGTDMAAASSRAALPGGLHRGTDSLILLDDTKHRARMAGFVSSWTTVKEAILREEFRKQGVGRRHCSASGCLCVFSATQAVVEDVSKGSGGEVVYSGSVASPTRRPHLLHTSQNGRTGHSRLEVCPRPPHPPQRSEARNSVLVEEQPLPRQWRVFLRCSWPG